MSNLQFFGVSKCLIYLGKTNRKETQMARYVYILMFYFYSMLQVCMCVYCNNDDNIHDFHENRTSLNL